MCKVWKKMKNKTLGYCFHSLNQRKGGEKNFWSNVLGCKLKRRREEIFLFGQFIWIHFANVDDLKKKIANEKPRMLSFKVVKKVVGFGCQRIFSFFLKKTNYFFLNKKQKAKCDIFH